MLFKGLSLTLNFQFVVWKRRKLNATDSTPNTLIPDIRSSEWKHIKRGLMEGKLINDVTART